uniref:U5-hexatoxin-Mr1a n=1 Tax=Macrothele raveni TaxID=269627 RepID=TXR1_MACRV|nr:RecName: Full=U5-hexatoxin-Mr1a; Short=U5-HXTX-Mr1a; AltName: Full=Raventoxin I; AltName: Full=Raventoxin-1 [Macrothele raveni]
CGTNRAWCRNAKDHCCCGYSCVKPIWASKPEDDGYCWKKFGGC